MFTEKTKQQAWSLYQASIKHSSRIDDNKKLAEEMNEYSAAKVYGQGDVTEEFTDMIIMLLRDYCYAVDPASYEQFSLYCDNMAEVMDHKTERTLKRFEDGFYK